MARIRQIHPTIWTDEAFMACSPNGRFLYLALVSLADDEGRMKASAIQIKHLYRPADGPEALVETECGLLELARHGMVSLYDVEGKRFLEVKNFAHYQALRWRTPSKLPGPDKGTAVSVECADANIAITPQVFGGHLSTLSPLSLPVVGVVAPSHPEDVTTSAAHAAAPKKPKKQPTEPTDTTLAVRAYIAAHEAKTGIAPIPPGAAENALAKAALKAIPLDEIRDLIAFYLERTAEPTCSHFFSRANLDRLRVARVKAAPTHAAPSANDRARARRLALCHAWHATWPYPTWVSVPHLPEPVYAKSFPGATDDDAEVLRFAHDGPRAQTTQLDRELRERADAEAIPDDGLAAWLRANVRAVPKPAPAAPTHAPAPTAEARSA